MTLTPEKFFIWTKEYPMFFLWAMDKDILFLPKEISETEENKQYDLVSKAYILMKRLGQDYEKIIRMDAEERDQLFEMEMQLIDEEKKQNEKNN